VNYAWLSDQALLRVEGAYRNSKRLLALLRHALPFQTNARMQEAMTAAINELVAYPDANLPE